MISFFVLLMMPMNVEASSFYHSHSSGCYTSGTGSCSNHTLVSYSSGDMKHCYSCGQMQPHSITQYSDRCLNGYVSDRTVGYWEICGVCGDTRRADSLSLFPPHSYTTSVLACSLPDGTPLGNATLSASETGWTNGAVIITAGADGLTGGYSLSSTPYDFGSGFTHDSSYTVTSNGVYSVTVQGFDGNTATASVTVSNIDTEAPSLSITKSTESQTYDPVTISVSGGDSLSGLPADCFSFNGGAYSSNDSITVSSNCTVTVSVIDNAGNVTSDTVSVSNIVPRPAPPAPEPPASNTPEPPAESTQTTQAPEATPQPGSTKPAGSGTKTPTTTNKTDGKKETGTKETPKDNTETVNKKTEGKDDEVSKGLTTGQKPDKSGAGTIKDGVYVSSEKAGSLSGMLEVVDATGKADDEQKEPEPITTVSAVSSESENANSQGAPEPLQELSVSDNMPVGEVLIISGSVLVFFALLMILSSNYVYTKKNGHKKLVAPVKVKKKNKRIIVHISEKRLTQGGKYYIFFSPINRLSLKKNRVYVMIKEKDTMINTDEGTTFTY